MSYARPALPDAIQQAREPRFRYETVVCYVAPRGLATDVVADAREKHYVGILRDFERDVVRDQAGARWLAFERDSARAGLALQIRSELAYAYRTMADAPAGELADRFIGMFEQDARFFSGMPTTRLAPQPANFDCGWLGIDAHRLGLLWFESTSPGR